MSAAGKINCVRKEGLDDGWLVGGSNSRSGPAASEHFLWSQACLSLDSVCTDSNL